MKRDYPQPQLHPPNPNIPTTPNPCGGSYSSAPNYSTGKSKMMWDPQSEQQQDAGVDELLALVGYNVRSSDMAGVAKKLEHLEDMMGQAQEDGLSHLATDTVHYNPADLSSWLESMICELEPFPGSDPFHGPAESSTTSNIIFDDSPDYDLTVIPGKAAVYPSAIPSPPNKKLKTSNTPPPTPSLAAPSTWPAVTQPQPQQQQTQHQQQQQQQRQSKSVVLVDSQENGVRLVHTLMACAEAVQKNNLKLAEALVKQMGFLAVSQIGAMRKVATYFAEALARRIYRLYPQDPHDSAFSDQLQMHFYEACPYLKFAHFTANQAILEALGDQKVVHVIDFSMKQGMQWPALMQALAMRPTGPPTFRLTGIGPPSHGNTDHLLEVGLKLAQFAEAIQLKFEYRVFVAKSLTDLEASKLDLREGETVAVNSVFEFHQLLARPGAIEKVMVAVKAMKPDIVTVVEQEANHNGDVFLDRFTESLHYYSTLFDSLESCGGGDDGSGAVSNHDKVMSEVFLGRQICNVVACEGVDRVERHETLCQWRARFGAAGFDPVHLGSNAYKQASILLAKFTGGDGYMVEENEGCLMLGWHTRPLITTSAWKLSG